MDLKPSDDQFLLTVKQVAALDGCSEKTVRRAIEAGLLPARGRLRKGVKSYAKRRATASRARASFHWDRRSGRASPA